MSSSYHICPTNVTFQFDTTFMYLIAVLMFMKLYQVVVLPSSMIEVINIIPGSTCRRLSKCHWCLFWSRRRPSLGNDQYLLQRALVLGSLLHSESLKVLKYYKILKSSAQVYIIVIVVVSVHAYNIGAVKYDWKILWVVAKYVQKAGIFLVIG